MSAWVREGGQWLHRPAWKRAINTVLRWLQPWTARKWVVYTQSSGGSDTDPPRALGYGFGRVLHRSDP